MAELMLQIQPGSGFEEGDIVAAFNRHRCQRAAAEFFAHPKHAPRNGSGLIVENSLCHVAFEHVYQYKFRRLSAKTLERIELATGTTQMFDGRQIEVRAFLFRRKKSSRHAIFGEDGAEFWYGGRVDVSEAATSAVWDAIETASPQRRSNHNRWVYGRMEKRTKLAIEVDEFDDTERNNLESPEVDDQGNVTRKRRHHVPFARLSMSPSERSEVADMAREFTLVGKGRQQNRSAVVRQKPRQGN